MSDMKIGDVYGKYSQGAGAILGNADKVWSDLADPEVLAGYETSMRRDMKKSGITPDILKSWHVMDVGTGRQALTFLNLGARKVSHFDFSQENCARVEAYRGASGLQEQLETKCCDIVETDLGTDAFDFVYLNGIVQHFSDVGAGISNCIKSLKVGGYLWLYFYRSGTFDNFVLQMLRLLANGANVVSDFSVMKEYYVNSLIYYSDTGKRNYLSSMFMDSVFTRYARLYSVKTYLDMLAAAGFEIVSSSGIDPLGQDVDHYFSRPATVVTARKISSDLDLAAATSCLRPEADVDQLDPSLYVDSEILESIRLYEELAECLDHPSVAATIRATVVLRLFHFLAHKTRQVDYDPMDRHRDLQELISSIITTISEEYTQPATG